MSNPNAPFGFRPVRRLDGAAPNYQTNAYLINTANTTKIFTGDAVIQDGSNAGYIAVAVATSTPILGIFAGCEWFDSSQQKKVFSPQWTGVTTVVSGGTIKAFVYDDPNIVFEAQSAGTTGAAAPQSKVFQNGKLSATTAGNSITGISGQSFDENTLATGQSAYPFKFVEQSQKVGNDNTSTYNLVEVVLNATNYKAGVA